MFDQNPKEVSAELLSAVIRSRRSVKPRLFNGERIPDATVWAMLEDATWAPTHGLTQPWRFHVYSGAALERLADFRQQWYREITPPAAFDAKKCERLRDNLLRSSHAVLLCLRRQASGQIPELEEIEAVACSAQNLMLSAHARGVQSFWGSGGDTYTAELHRFLGLDASERCLGTLYLGYSDRPQSRSKRANVRDVVCWVEA